MLDVLDVIPDVSCECRGTPTLFLTHRRPVSVFCASNLLEEDDLHAKTISEENGDKRS